MHLICKLLFAEIIKVEEHNEEQTIGAEWFICSINV
jgi:hypothetical protein